MFMWVNKKYYIDKLINDNNGFDNLKKLAELLYGSDSICKRWNRTSIDAYRYLEVSNIPINNYQMTVKNISK